MDETHQKVRQYVQNQFLGGEAQLDDDEDLFELGIVDSLGFLTLVSFLENQFGIRFEGDQLDVSNFCSVHRISRMVNEQRKT